MKLKIRDDFLDNFQEPDGFRPEISTDFQFGFCYPKNWQFVRFPQTTQYGIILDVNHAKTSQNKFARNVNVVVADISDQRADLADIYKAYADQELKITANAKRVADESFLFHGRKAYRQRLSWVDNAGNRLTADQIYVADGVPTNLMLRRVLEECSSIEEAAKLLRSVERASRLNVAICDRNRGAVLEVTTKNIVERASEDGVCICTNHFRSSELATSTECWRYDSLAKSANMDNYAVRDLAKRLHAVNQGASTLQTMIFEPSALRLHLAFGEGPATRLPMKSLELSELFHRDKPAP